MLVHVLTVGLALANPNDLSTVQLATSVYSTCYAKFASAACWGTSFSGTLGRGDADEDVPLASDAVAIDFGTSFVVESIYAGYGHHCAVSVERCTKCWGSNDYGALGDGSYINRGGGSSSSEMGEMGDAWPCVNFNGNFIVDTLGVGADFNCALSTNHAVRCWGTNGVCQLGINRDTGTRYPAPTSNVNFGGGGFVPVQLSCGDKHSCAVSAQGKCMCWGGNTRGALGQDLGSSDINNGYGSLLPLLVEIPIMPIISFVDAGLDSTCAVDADGRMVCWGSNAYGELGYNDTINRGDSPGDMADLQFVELGAGFAVRSLFSGSNHRCATSTKNQTKVCDLKV